MEYSFEAQQKPPYLLHSNLRYILTPVK
jgi:hypothetical protein